MTHDKKRLLSIGEAAKALEVPRPLLYSRHRLAHPEHPHSAESRSLAG